MANIKINQNTHEKINTKERDNMSSEWFYTQQWAYKRWLREQEEKDKKTLNKKENSIVEDTEPETEDNNG